MSEMCEFRMSVAALFKAMPRFCPNTLSPCTYRRSRIRFRGTALRVVWDVPLLPSAITSPAPLAFGPNSRSITRQYEAPVLVASAGTLFGERSLARYGAYAGVMRVPAFGSSDWSPPVASVMCVVPPWAGSTKFPT
jgi:hypothetical protein